MADVMDIAALVARLRLKGQQDREMPNHYVRRMSLERAEAADAIEAQAHEIEALKKDQRWIIKERDATFALMLARAEAAEAKVTRLVEALQDADQAVMESTTDHEWLAGGGRISADIRAALAEIGGGNG